MEKASFILRRGVTPDFFRIDLDLYKTVEWPIWVTMPSSSWLLLSWTAPDPHPILRSCPWTSQSSLAIQCVTNQSITHTKLLPYMPEVNGGVPWLWYFYSRGVSMSADPSPPSGLVGEKGSPGFLPPAISILWFCGVRWSPQHTISFNLSLFGKRREAGSNPSEGQGDRLT